MSISPFKPEDRPLKQWKSSAAQSSLAGESKEQALTLSQALTITAGMAGLIGLISGIVIRFSLANSTDSEARFLSPLQTFPELSDWTPQLPQETADSHYLPGGTRRDSWESESSADAGTATQPFQEEVDITNFDAFADRTEDAQSFQDLSSQGVDPYERLREGPQLRGEDPTEGEIGIDANGEYDAWDSELEDESTTDTWAEDDWAEDNLAEDDQTEDGESDVVEDYKNYFDEVGSEPFIDSSSDELTGDVQ
ncbi:MAG: hypothetical protein AAFY72_12865 [Cyanobacteria bacterium J06649_4]